MITLIWLVIVLALLAAFLRFLPITALWMIVPGGLYMAGVIPASDGFFTTLVWGFVACVALDCLGIFARVTGFGNRIRITR